MRKSHLPETWPHCGQILWPPLTKSKPHTKLRLIDHLVHNWNETEISLYFDPWHSQARPDQFPPPCTSAGNIWTSWLIMGGRGAGKTRAGAEFIRGVALGRMGYAHHPAQRIALVGETMAQVRDVMIEGVSGLLAIHQDEDRPRWEPSKQLLTWPNGAIAQVFSADNPDSLRGPQFECAWLDELAKWPYAEQTFDMLQFGLRLGAHPRQVITTTPRPIPLLRRLLNDPRTAVTRAATLANQENLSPAFLEMIVNRYKGTQLGRQELDGEIIEERSDALWTRDMLEAQRVELAPNLERIVVALDPPAAAHRRADNCGLVVAGRDEEGRVYVLKDASLCAARPEVWSRVAVKLWHEYEADSLIAEVNQGGEMVASVIAAADKDVPVRQVRATRGKYLRAAPVAQLYEQGRVYHVGTFPALEDEMCAFGPDGLSDRRSPDRLDALVWAVTDLALNGPSEAHIRGLGGPTIERGGLHLW